MPAFSNLIKVREQAEELVADYNNEIPRDSLDGLTPVEFRVQNDPATSSLVWH
jgi:putative transposase